MCLWCCFLGVRRPSQNSTPLMSNQLLRMRKLERNAPFLMKREPELERPGGCLLRIARVLGKMEPLGPLWFAEEERKHTEEEGQKECVKQQRMKYMMLNDEEKLILLRRVHDLEEVNVKTRSMNEKIAKESEDVSRMLRQMQRGTRGVFSSRAEVPHPQRVRRPRLRRRSQRNRKGEV